MLDLASVDERRNTVVYSIFDKLFVIIVLLLLLFIKNWWYFLPINEYKLLQFIRFNCVFVCLFVGCENVYARLVFLSYSEDNNEHFVLSVWHFFFIMHP